MISSSPQEFFIDRYQQRFNVHLDSDWSLREKKLHILSKFLDDSIYDNLLPFYSEFSGEKYVPLANRRPSVIYSLLETIVNDSVTMLFGEEHFPSVQCSKDHQNTIEFLNKINSDTDLKSKMLCAAYEGSIGSVCIVVKVLNGKFCFEVLNTKTLHPLFDLQNPGMLIKLIDKRKIDGSTINSTGYKINKDDLNKFFYVVREWNINQEIYYKPYLVEEEKNESFTPTIDANRTTTHDLGFVPAMWINNLPSSKGIDGKCTFEKAIDIAIEINYQLSQHGRLLKYNSDPTLVVKNPSSLEGSELIKGIGTLNLDADGEAYLLEMKGSITKSVLDYAETLRKYALESVRGDRSSPDKIHAAQSGKALQFLNHPLITLVSDLRLSYGEYGLKGIYKIIMKICKSKKIDINYDGGMPDINELCEDHLVLDWPDWYPSTAQDDFNEAQTNAIYLTNNILSKETILQSLADEYHIMNVNDELNKINNDMHKNSTNDKKTKSNDINYNDEENNI